MSAAAVAELEATRSISDLRKRAGEFGLITKLRKAWFDCSREDILQKAKQSLMSAEDLNAITNPDVFRKTSFELGLTVRFKAAGSSKFKYLFSG